MPAHVFAFEDQSNQIVGDRFLLGRRLKLSVAHHLVSSLDRPNRLGHYRDSGFILSSSSSSVSRLDCRFRHCAWTQWIRSGHTTGRGRSSPAESGQLVRMTRLCASPHQNGPDIVGHSHNFALNRWGVHWSRCESPPSASDAA